MCLSDDSELHVGRFTGQWVEYGRYQSGMLWQLYEFATAAMQSHSGEPTSGGKPKSRPPFDMGILDLMDHCQKVVDEAISQRTSPTEYDGMELRDLYRKARMVLGYDAPIMFLPAVVCHDCGGPLIVASDASSSVLCAEGCGVEYPTHTWLELLVSKEAS